MLQAERSGHYFSSTPHKNLGTPLPLALCSFWLNKQTNKDNHLRKGNLFSLAIEVMEIVSNLDTYISESIKVSAKSIKLDNNDESETCCGYIVEMQCITGFIVVNNHQ